MLNLQPPIHDGLSRLHKLAHSATSSAYRDLIRHRLNKKDGASALLSMPPEILRLVLDNLSFTDLRSVQVTCSQMQQLATPMLWNHLDVNASIYGYQPGLRPQMAKYLGPDCSTVCFPDSLQCHHNCRHGYIGLSASNIESFWKTVVGGTGPHRMPFNHVQVLTFYLDEYSPVLFGSIVQSLTGMSAHLETEIAQGMDSDDATPELFHWFLMTIVPKFFTNIKLVEINTGYRQVPLPLIQGMVTLVSRHIPNASINVEAWLKDPASSVTAEPGALAAGKSGLTLGGPVCPFSLFDEKSLVPLIAPQTVHLRLFLTSAHLPLLRDYVENHSLPANLETVFLHINGHVNFSEGYLTRLFVNCKKLKVLSLKGISCTEETYDWVPKSIEKFCLDWPEPAPKDGSNSAAVSTPPARSLALVPPPSTVLPNVTYFRVMNASAIGEFPVQLPALKKFVISGKGDNLRSLETICESVLRHSHDVRQLTCRSVPFYIMIKLVEHLVSTLESVMAESDGSDPDNLPALAVVATNLKFLHIDMKGYANAGGNVLELAKFLLHQSPQLQTLLLDHQFSSLPRLKLQRGPVSDGYSKVLFSHKAFSLDLDRFRDLY